MEHMLCLRSFEVLRHTILTVLSSLVRSHIGFVFLIFIWEDCSNSVAVYTVAFKFLWIFVEFLCRYFNTNQLSESLRRRSGDHDATATDVLPSDADRESCRGYEGIDRCVASLHFRILGYHPR